MQSYVWPRLRHVIALWVARVTGLPNASILWSEQNQPSPALPYVGLTRRNFPLDGGDEEITAEITTSVRLTCTATGVGSTFACTLFGTRYAYTLAVGETTEDARDALLAAISADVIRVVTSSSGRQFGVGFQPCTAAVAGSDAIDFAGLGFGPVHLSAVEGCSLGNEVLAYRVITKGLRRALVRVELFWPELPAPFETADAYANALRDSLLEEETATWLASRGVGVEQAARLTIQDASAVAGGALRETRLMMDVLFNATSKRYRADNGIGGVTPPVVVAIPPTEI